MFDIKKIYVYIYTYTYTYLHTHTHYVVCKAYTSIVQTIQLKVSK